MVTKTIAMLADLYGDLKRNFKSLSPTCTWGTIINQKAKNYEALSYYRRFQKENR